MNRARSVRPHTLIALSALVATLGLPYCCRAQDLPPSQAIVSADGKKMVVYHCQQLVFYDGIGPDARVLAKVNCKDQRVTASKQGKFVALCSQFVDATCPVRIFNNLGQQVGGFDLELPWKVHAVSDSGPLVSLGAEKVEPTSPLPRLCDSAGRILVKYDNPEDEVRLEFAFNGAPMAWGVRGEGNGRRAFVTLFNPDGTQIAEHTYADSQLFIEEVAYCPNSKTMVLEVEQRKRGGPPSLDGQIHLWRTDTGAIRSVSLDAERLGAIQPGTAISPDGSFVAARVGAAGVVLIDTSAASVAAEADLDAHFEFVHSLDVTDAGTVLVLGYRELKPQTLRYGWLTREGDPTAPTELPGHGKNKYSLGNIGLQRMANGSIAIVSPTDRVDTVSPHFSPLS